MRLFPHAKAAQGLFQDGKEGKAELISLCRGSACCVGRETRASALLRFHKSFIDSKGRKARDKKQPRHTACRSGATRLPLFISTLRAYDRVMPVLGREPSGADRARSPMAERAGGLACRSLETVLFLFSEASPRAT